MRFWSWYAVHILGLPGDILPPDLDGLLAWSRLFRCHSTFGNYLSYVKLACEIKGVSVSVFQHPSLKRAKVAIEKRRWLHSVCSVPTHKLCPSRCVAGCWLLACPRGYV